MSYKIEIDIKNNPEKYTYWFKYIIENHIKEIEENLNFQTYIIYYYCK